MSTPLLTFLIFVGLLNIGVLLIGAALEAHDAIRRYRKAARQKRIGRELAERSWTRPAEIQARGGNRYISSDERFGRAG